MTLHRILINISAVFLLIPFLSSCDSMIYDEEGDCAPYYKVRFIYDTNLKFVDAFSTEVQEVTLWLVDPATGDIVWQKHESGEALSKEGYLMDVDVDPGRYTLVAWAGSGHTSSFRVADALKGEDLRCRLEDRTPSLSGNDRVDNRLNRLFHGREENVEFEDRQGVHIKTVRLIKDTNELHIILQHLSGENIDHNDYTFTVTSDNGHLDWDNSVIPEKEISYFAHTSYSGMAGVEVPDDGQIIGRNTRTMTSVSAAVGHISLSRLMVDDNTFVRIYNKEGECIVKLPLVDYAILIRNEYPRPNGKFLSKQEYLDYQDEYSMTFFLDRNGRWMNTYILVHTWRKEVQDVDL